MNFLNEKLSTRAKNALTTAQKISQELGHDQIGTGHLFYGIISEESSFATEVLLKNKINKELVRLELVRLYKKSDSAVWKPKLSANFQTVLEKSATVAARYQYPFIGTEHFLFSMIALESCQTRKVLQNLNIDAGEIKKKLLNIFENISKFPDSAKEAEIDTQLDDLPPLPGSSALEYFTIDLTERAKQGQIDPLIGRTKETERVISIISRRNKNNPLLIGEPGVGKTAIAEGLAQAIYDQNVPEHLMDKRVLNLDLASMVAGTMFRGEFEQRLKQTIDEIIEAGNIILFIDEVHMVVGAGSASGSMDAANILKPALAKGQLRAIGATTLKEYKKHLEQDPALERRFQPVFIKEPTTKETVDILKGLKKRYEDHHGVKITDKSIEHAVALSNRYIRDRFQPDKAIDLLDETSAFLNIIHSRKLPKSKSVKRLDRTIADLTSEKQKAVFEQNFQLAAKIKYRLSRLSKVKKTIIDQSVSAEGAHVPEISEDHIAETVSRITNIPVGRILKKEMRELLSLEPRLRKKIIGQDHAIKEIASSLRRSRAGINEPTRPLGSFMFLGPSGVGKTLLGKLLAEELFGSASALIRIDMSEFMERHNVARLTGAPAGYVGFGEGGTLTENLRRNPYSVVLFDEIEKAHPDVMNLLLQILDEGHLTDAEGRKIDCRNTIIIMTSNIGLAELNNWAKNYGFGIESNSAKKISHEEISREVHKQIEQRFRMEFLNRIDKTLVFHPLGSRELRKIVRLELKNLQNKLAGQDIKLEFDAGVVDFLAEKSADWKEGARKIRKNLQEHVEDMIADQILNQKISRDSSVKLRKQKHEIVIAAK